MITKFKLYENNMTENQIRKFYERELDIPIHKIKYLLNVESVYPSLLFGALKKIEHYNVELTEEIFNIFYDVISAKLEGTYDIEHEFEENEYNTLMNIKSYINEYKNKN